MNHNAIFYRAERVLLAVCVASLGLALPLFFPFPPPARAGGSVTTCTEAGLDATLAGGTVTFNCGGTNSPATISLTSQKTITASTTIDGGNVITISGGNSTSLFLVNSGVTLTLNAITLTQGHTSGGGGCLYVNGTLVANAMTVTNCVASGSASGGGIYVNSTGRATLTNVTLNNNSATTYGGGIHNAGTAVLANVTLSYNTISGSCFPGGCYGSGGGMYNNGTATLTNVTLSANAANGWLDVDFCWETLSCIGTGGGISNYGTATLINVTLSGNSVTGCCFSMPGGGIYNYLGTSTLTNTIVANSPYGGNCNTTLGGSSNLSDDNTCGFGAGRDNVPVMLGALANNGGATQTHALLSGSPAIDFGTNTGCPSTDQRSKARPVDGDKNGTPTCDVGAYEAELYLFLPLIMK